MRIGWHYDVWTARWRSDPVVVASPYVSVPIRLVAAETLDTIEDVELYAAELGMTRTQIHGPHSAGWGRGDR